MFDSKIESRKLRSIVSHTGDTVIHCYLTGGSPETDWKRDFSVWSVMDGIDNAEIYRGVGGRILDILAYLNHDRNIPEDMADIAPHLDSIKRKYKIDKPSLDGLDENSPIATINLTQGMVAVVDEALLEWLSWWKWYAYKDVNTFYAGTMVRSDKRDRRVSMHRLILNASPNMEVDHRDGNGLCNRVCNIRVCTSKENGRNRIHLRNNTSGYKGVNWNCGHQKWLARIMVDWKSVSLGYFDDVKEAAKAYNEAAIKYHGEFARLNTID